MKNIRNCVSGNADFVSHWHSVCDKMESEEEAWIASLRASGFKASHPNDGWVNRGKNELRLVYPQFNDGVDVGDRIMLGWAHDKESHRPVTVTGISEGFFSGLIYKFKDCQ